MLLLLVSTNVFAFSLFGPKNYDECVLENMKGVSSDTAARLVANSCREKFKEKVVDNSKKYKWTLIERDDVGARFDDESNIIRHGKVVTIIILIDFNKLQLHNNEQSYSNLINIEYDCGNLSFRVLNFEEKSGHMGEGITVVNGGIQEEGKFTKDHGAYKRYCTN